jgi:hypothetical protein
MMRNDTERLLASLDAMWRPFTPLTREQATQRLNNWQAALERDMTPEFALGVLRKIYATPGTREPKPGDLNAAWKKERLERDRPRPCGNPMCDGHGWINGRQSNGNLIAEKCPDCPPRIRTSGLHHVHADNTQGVPMPDDVRQLMHQLNRKGIQI